MQWESTLTHNDSKSGDSEEDRSAKWFFLSPLLVFASYVATFIVLSIVVPHRVDFPARPADIPWVPFLILGASLPILFSSAVILWILPSGRDRNFAWAIAIFSWIALFNFCGCGRVLFAMFEGHFMD